MKHAMYKMIGSAFGLGLSPFFPGTCGALLGVAIHGMIVWIVSIQFQLPALVAVFILVCGVNHWLTPWAVQYWNSQDPKHFVLDEVAGYLIIPLLFRPCQSWKVMLLGFLCFRVFDIFKFLPPTQYIDRHIHGAWGILLDDLVSGTYAAIVLHGVWRVHPVWLRD